MRRPERMKENSTKQKHDERGRRVSTVGNAGHGDSTPVTEG